MQWTSLIMVSLLLTEHGVLPLQTMNSVAVMQPLLADLIFTDNLLFEQKAVSPSDCAAVCLATDRCALFTVTSLAPAMSGASAMTWPFRCRGHSSVVRQGGGNQLTLGTQFFSIIPRVSAWLEIPCTIDTECGVPLSECFAGTCLCTPGYYYSHTADSCIDSCLKIEQQETYLQYPGVHILENNEFCAVAGPRCQQICREDAYCRTFEKWSSGRCCFNAVTPLDVSPQHWQNHTYAVFHIMTCL